MKREVESKEKSEGSTRSPWRGTKPRLLILLAALVVIALILAYSSWASAPTPSNSVPASSIKTPNLMLSPANQKVALSSSLAVKIWANTGGQKVNTVEANLSYPIDRLNFVNVDSTGSAFGLTVQGSGGDGKITIARGSFEPVSGKLLIATVNFTGADKQGVATVNFAGGTALVSATTHKDILAGTYGGSYTLTQ